MARSLAYDPKFALNAICPYFTMFPLEYPLNALKKHIRAGGVVFDPFCGRGTTLYAARILGMTGWGLDTSPIAVAVAKAKLAQAKSEAILQLAESFLGREPVNIPQTEFFRYAYAPETLQQLCALREGLLSLEHESGESTILRAAALGCLHGPLNQTKEGMAYFSNQMPRTFASKPDYSVGYWKKRNMIAPKIDVLQVIKRKLSRIKDLDRNADNGEEQVLCLNSCSKDSYSQLPGNISTVVTSPPYYGMRTYVQDQWLRNWFLGGPETVNYANEDQIKHNTVDSFVNDLGAVWRNIAASTVDEVHYYIRFGSLPSTKKDARTILRNSFDVAGGLKVVSVRNASDANAGKRQADQMKSESIPVDEFDFHVIRR